MCLFQIITIQRLLLNSKYQNAMFSKAVSKWNKHDLNMPGCKVSLRNTVLMIC